MSPDPPVRFDARLELMPWGRNVYTVIKVPNELAARAGRESTRRVEGSLDGLAVNVGLNRADVIPDTFVYVGSGLQQRLGVRAGDVVRCVLAPADPDHVPVPDDVLDALKGGRAAQRLRAQASLRATPAAGAGRGRGTPRHPGATHRRSRCVPSCRLSLIPSIRRREQHKAGSDARAMAGLEVCCPAALRWGQEGGTGQR